MVLCKDDSVSGEGVFNEGKELFFIVAAGQ